MKLEKLVEGGINRVRKTKVRKYVYTYVQSIILDGPRSTCTCNSRNVHDFFPPAILLHANLTSFNWWQNEKLVDDLKKHKGRASA